MRAVSVGRGVRVVHVALAIVAASCGDDITEPEGPTAPAAVRIVSGDGQTAWTGTTLAGPVVVTVEDAGGHAVPGVEVLWAVGDGSGTIAPERSTTDSDGEAHATWTLGDVEGEQTATATVQGVATASFSAIARRSAVAAVVIDEPADPLTWLGEVTRLQASALDDSGNELSDVAIRWSSLDTDVAAVDERGEVGARGDGIARIVATAESAADTVDVTVTFDRPAWRFSVLATVTRATAEHYGGLDSVSALIDEQMDTVTVRFNRPLVIAGFLEFAVDSIHVLDGPLDQELCRAHPHQDFRVIYDGFPTQGGGWYGGCTAIHHAWSVESFGGTFAATATDGLVHELGHARGAIDLYALEVAAEGNPVNGASYAAETSIMTYPYGVRVWDPHSVWIIGSNRDVASPPIEYITRAFPSSMGVRVEDATGARVADAEVHLHPVAWFSGEVDATPIPVGSTDSNGELDFDANPFGPDDPTAAWNISYATFLVVVTSGDTEAHAWMPLTAVQNAYFESPQAPYRLRVTF